MSKQILNWSNLFEELVDIIANNVFSNVELLRIRSICKSWRSAAAKNKRFPNHNNRKRKRILSPYKGEKCLLSPAAFFRVVSSSCPNKGWLIKTQDVTEFSKKLLCPLSRTWIDKSSDKTLDLLDFTVSEIHQSYDVEYLRDDFRRISCDFARVVLVDNLVFGVDCYKKIWWCCSVEDESDNDHVWTRILDEEVEYFSDIIVHNGHIFALDLKGAVWWISLSELNIFQYGPSTPLEYYEVDDCKDKRLVVYYGDLCVVHRFCKEVKRCRNKKTVGFKVYKMDEEIVEWVEVKSLGDEAIVMATDSCFTVLAKEYYGCFENSIYFTDEGDGNNVKVFKLGDGSITTMAKSSCENMFSPPFV